MYIYAKATRQDLGSDFGLGMLAAGVDAFALIAGVVFYCIYQFIF